MIITCPDCSKRYIVAESAIGETGRQVRCANCGYEWFQEGVGGGAKAEDGPQEDKELHVYQDEEPDLDFDAVDTPAPVVEEEEPLEEIPEAVKPLPEEEYDPPVKPEDILPPAAWQPLAGGYGAAFAILLLLISALIGLKDTMTNAWPASAMLYSMIGLDTRVPGEGLTFDRVIAKADKNEKGENILKLSGNVLNLTRDEVKVPAVFAALLLEDGSAQEKWLIDLGVDSLPAEESVPFEIDYPLTSKEVTSVNVTFLAGKFEKPQNEEKIPEKEQHEELKEKSHEEHHDGDHH